MVGESTVWRGAQTVQQGDINSPQAVSLSIAHSGSAALSQSESQLPTVTSGYFPQQQLRQRSPKVNPSLQGLVQGAARSSLRLAIQDYFPLV